jgi:acyl-CoA synthetase (NDP forming)
MSNSKTSSKGRRKGHAIELSAKAAFFWGLCLFFLLAWIFVLGILVGRGFVPDGVQSISELKAQIAKLQGLIGHGDSSKSETPTKSFEDPKLAFYENLSKKKKAVARDQLTSDRQKKPNKPVAHREESGKKKTGQGPEVAQAGGKFTIQIASLGIQKKAEAFVRKLTAKGYPAYYYEVRVNGSSRYRVRCGSFKTAEEAKGFANELFRAEKIKGFVLRAKK